MPNCVNHPLRRALHECRRCGKPLCDQCNAEGNRFCSRECDVQFQEFQQRIPETPTVRRKRFSVLGCLKSLIISAVLIVVITFALSQLFGTTDPDEMWSELKRMWRIAF